MTSGVQELAPEWILGNPDEQNLNSEFEASYDPEVHVVEKVCENVHFISVNSAVQQVEDIHEDKGIEAKGVKLKFWCFLIVLELLIKFIWLCSDHVEVYIFFVKPWV